MLELDYKLFLALQHESFCNHNKDFFCFQIYSDEILIWSDYANTLYIIYAYHKYSKNPQSMKTGDYARCNSYFYYIIFKSFKSNSHSSIVILFLSIFPRRETTRILSLLYPRLEFIRSNEGAY